MTGQTYVRSLLRPALNADLIVSIHRVIQKGSDFISIESTSDLTRAIQCTVVRVDCELKHYLDSLLCYLNYRFMLLEDH